MTPAVRQILEATDALSTEEWADLSDELTVRMNREIPQDISAAHLAEVRRRLAEVESGKVTPIPGEEAMARIWQRLRDRSQPT